MKRVKRFFERMPDYLPTALTLAAILWLTLAPRPIGDEDIPLFPGADKIIHALMFGFLTVILCTDRQSVKRWRPLRTRTVLIFAAASSALGVGIEFAQKAMAMGRAFEWADAYSDIAGSALAALIWIFFQPRWSETDNHYGSRKEK